MIGGGVIGCSIAFFLSKAEVDVVLLEKNEIASGTSGSNQGGFVSQYFDSPLLELILASKEIYKKLKEDLNDIEFDSSGSLLCTTEEKGCSLLEDRAQKLCHFLPVSLLDGDELRELDSNLSKDIIGGLLCNDDFLVNPFKLTYSFAGKARELGAKLYTRTEAKKIIVRNGEVKSVLTSQGKIETDHVIISAGPWSRLIDGIKHLNIPVRPQRGQVLITEAMTFSTNFRYIVDADYMITAYNRESAEKSSNPRIRRGIASSLSQTHTGHWLIGSSRDLAGFDKRTTLIDIRLLANRCLKLLPFLKYTYIIRAFAGLRPLSDDGLPIIGKVPNIDGLILATGHAGEGVMLAPITGKVVSEILTTDDVSVNIEKFKYSRFNP